MPTIIPPEKSVAVFRSLCYVTLVVATVWVLLAPPSTVKDTMGGIPTFLWGASMLSAFVGLAASFK